MTLNYVTLTGTLPNAGGAVLQAVLSGWTPDATDELLFPPAGPPPVTLANATVNGQPAGTFSLPGLVANDNANLPAGTYWTVTIKGIAGVGLFEQVYVLDYANGASQDISGLASYEPPAPVTAVMPLPSGTPTAGMVPVATGTGQGSEWQTPAGAAVTSVNDDTGAVTITYESIGADQAGAAEAAQSAAETYAEEQASAAQTAAEQASLPIGGGTLTGSLTIDGTLEVGSLTATGEISSDGSAAAGGLLVITNTHTTPTAPTVQFIAETAADELLGLQVTGDTYWRFASDSNGKLQWGSGAGAADTNLYRTAANSLKTDYSLTVSESLYVAGSVLTVSTSGAALDYGLSGGGAFKITNTSTPTAPTTQLIAHAAADPTLGIEVSGDTDYRLLVDSNGKHTWGPGGSTAGDTNLYRSSAGLLRTDESLTVGETASVGTLEVTAGGITIEAGALVPATESLTFGSSIAVNAALANDVLLTLTASTGTIAAPSNPAAAQTLTFWITQGTGGGFTVDWASGTGGFNFGTATAPTLSTTAGDVDMVGFKYNAALARWCYAGVMAGF